VKPNESALERIQTFEKELRRSYYKKFRRNRDFRSNRDKNRADSLKPKPSNQKPQNQKINAVNEISDNEANSIESIENDEVEQWHAEMARARREGGSADHLFQVHRGSVAVAEIEDHQIQSFEWKESPEINRAEIQLPNDEFDIRCRFTNPKLNPEIDLSKEGMQDTVAGCYNASQRERSSEEQKLYKQCLEATPVSSDAHMCEVTLNVCGLRVHSILLDSGAQSNVISMGAVCTLAALAKGQGFRTALKTCNFTTPHARQLVSGITGNVMAVQGTIVLTIEVKNQIFKMPFTLINSPRLSIVIGTPGLRMLKFSLHSPLFGKINFLNAPHQREMKEAESEEQSAPKALTHEDRPKEEQKIKRPIYRKKNEKKTSSAEPAVKRGPGRPRRNEREKEEKVVSEAKDPLVRALLGQKPLTAENKQNFREAGVVKSK